MSRTKIIQMVAESIIAAPVLIVPKSDGTGRLCVDSRRLNAETEQGPFPSIAEYLILGRTE